MNLGRRARFLECLVHIEKVFFQGSPKKPRKKSNALHGCPSRKFQNYWDGRGGPVKIPGVLGF